MSGLQRAIGWIGTLQLAILFAALIVRRHYRLLPLFTLYVGTVALTSLLLGLLYSWETWMAYQVSVAALRFGVALELTYGIFGAFPAAASTARRVTFALLVVTAATAMSVGPGDYRHFNTIILPRLATGTVWILTALAALVLWYRVPLGVLQKAILIGLAPYLIVFTVMMNLLASFGWRHREWVGYVDTLSYLALITYWCWVAWRTAPEAATSYARVLVSQAPRRAS
jgi:hypothetical protein